MSARSFKRTVYSLLIVLLWLGFVVDGAHALFVDSATLTGNSISTGNADLLISNSQNPTSTTYDDSRPGFALTLSPGETQEKFFLLKNNSGANIPFDVLVEAASATGSAGLRQAVSLTIYPVDETGIATGTGIHGTLESLLGMQSAVLATINKGVAQRFKMQVSLGPGYDQQGQSLSYDLVFTGIQSLPQ